MKKNLLLVLGLSLAVGANAQKGLGNIQKRGEAPAKGISEYYDFNAKAGGFNAKAGVDTVQYFDLSDNTGWVIDNDNQTGADFGWAFTSTKRSWAGNGTFPSSFHSSSGGQYLELKNGNPTVNPGTQKLNVDYKVTSPAIAITSNEVSLRYQQVGARFNDLQEVQISIDGGTTWTAVDDNSDKAVLSAGGGAAYANPTVENVNLSSFIPVGTTSIMVRFHWTTNFPTQASNPNAWVTYGWGIDDIMIFNNPQYDLITAGAFATSSGIKYTKIPTSQKQDFILAHAVKNNGFGSLTGIVGAADLTSPAGSSVIHANGNAATLAPGAIDTLAHTITVTAEGDYTVNGIEAFAAEADADSTNNADPYSYTLSYGGTIYALDAGAPNDGLDFENANAEYHTGNAFDIVADTKMYGVDIYLASNTNYKSTVGTEIFGAVRDANTSMFDVIMQTPLYTLDGSENNKWITLVFESPVDLYSGKTYIATVGTYGSGATTGNDLVVGASGTSLKSTSFLYTASQSTTAWYYTLNTPMVRMNLTPGLVSTTNLNESVKANIYPNPAKDKAIVDFNTAFAGNVTISVVDLSGRTVYTNTIANQAAGNNKVELNVADFNAGVYQVVINANSSTITKKLVIK